MKYPGRKPYLRDKPWEAGTYSRYKPSQPWERYNGEGDDLWDDEEEALKNKYRSKSYGMRGNWPK